MLLISFHLRPCFGNFMFHNFTQINHTKRDFKADFHRVILTVY
jgi:hypothetical protein